MTHITQNGTELELRPVSDFLITKVRAQVQAEFEKEHGAMPERPTYEIKCGGGPFGNWTETRTHTEKTILDGTEEEKALWARYIELRRELNGLVWTRTARVYLLDGMPDPPENGWVEKQERRGLEIPEDPDERKMHWIETEVVVSNQELIWLVKLIQGQSNFTEAGRQLAADTFRRAMEQIGRLDAITNS
jgi:hypothetical protein